MQQNEELLTRNIIQIYKLMLITKTLLHQENFGARLVLHTLCTNATQFSHTDAPTCFINSQFLFTGLKISQRIY